MSDPTPYVVRGVRHSMRSTYNCPTAEWALKKLRDFAGDGYIEISCTGPDGRPVLESELVTLIEGVPAGGGPVDVDAPNALALLALA